ncbi:MAG: hypothetical protein GY842_22950 [bacterium]|nr:hypothetical protein [bacterium]
MCRLPLFGGVLVAVWLAGSPGIAQVMQPIDGRVDGRVLDASNQLGARGINALQPQSLPNAANFVITGNVSGGRAFRGFSPIRDPNSLFLTMPSAGLSSFQRDSVSVADVLRGRTPSMVSPFFAPTATATSVGSVRSSLIRHTPGTLDHAFAIPRSDPRTGRPFNPSASLNPASRMPDFDPFNRRSLPETATGPTPLPTDPGVFPGTSVFGAPHLIDPHGLGSGLGRAEGGLPGYSPYSEPAGEYGSSYGRDGALSGGSGVLDRVFGAGIARTPAELAPSLYGDPTQPSLPDTWRTSQMGFAAGAPGAGASGTPPPFGLVVPRVPLARDDQPDPSPIAGWTPQGISVYGDFRQAVSLVGAATEQQQVDATAPLDIALDEGLDREALESPTQGMDSSNLTSLRQALEQAPQTFAGAVETDLNVRIRAAEALMRAGEFYRATEEYAVASTLARNDPLIRMGLAHAYLAAGDYLSAVHHLTRGLERFPEIGQFRLDLYQFVDDPSVLDIRRADLENKLEQRDDYRLRFLLGYAEYYGGSEEFGMFQLERAAEAAPPGSIIARLPALLKAGGAAPAAKTNPK